MQLVEITRGRKYDSPARTSAACCAALAARPRYLPGETWADYHWQTRTITVPEFAVANLPRETPKSPDYSRPCHPPPARHELLRSDVRFVSLHLAEKNKELGRARQINDLVRVYFSCIERISSEYFGATARDLSPRGRSEERGPL